MSNHPTSSRNGRAPRPCAATGTSILLALMVAAGWLAPFSAEAASPYWKLANEAGAWETGSNWNSGIAAGAGDRAGIGLDAATYIVNISSNSGNLAGLARIITAEGGGTSTVNQLEGVTVGAYQGVYIGYSGVGVYNLAGTLKFGTAGLVLAAGSGTRGTVNLGSLTEAGNLSQYAGYETPIKVRDVVAANTLGLVRGWGSITLTNNHFFNNGRVVADGWGAATDRALRINLAGSGVITGGTSTVQADGTTPGWYATRRGQLILPSLSVAGGSSTNMWGEPQSDTTPDMVNSVRLEYNGVTGGSLGISLLATDHSAVPLGQFTAGMITNGFLSVYDVNGSNFTFGGGSLNLTFRYDDLLAATNGILESDLHVYHYTGGLWQDVTTSLDTGANTISANGISSLSYFAVGYAIPEPTSLVLLALAGLGLAFARRTRA